MTRFRPCIDLHNGKVKQIVGGTLACGQTPRINHESHLPASWFAHTYRTDKLTGGHMILLGPNNETAAAAALGAWPGGLQVGGGVTADNAQNWLNMGASHVIATSYLFSESGNFSRTRLEKLSEICGPDKLVIDLSCRKNANGWQVAMNRWQLLTDMMVTPKILNQLSRYCSQFLVHAADVEGLCSGIDESLVAMLGSWGELPITYAGGARSMDDFTRVEDLSKGKVDLTVGSALDMFGGSLILYDDCVAWNRRESKTARP